MAQQKKGFITRLLEGKERSEEYARSTLPTNRWQLFWDIFKGSFRKLFKVNLLIIVFLIPLILVLVLFDVYKEGMGITYPFGANLGIGYPATPDMRGVSEWLSLQNDLMMGIGLIIASFLAAVGIAGGIYVVRNMVWTEGVFVTNDFWRGVKLNYKNALQTALFFCVFFLLSKSMINLSEFTLAAGETTSVQRVLMEISKVTGYVFIVVTAMMSFWMLALGVNYKMGFWLLLKNSFLMVIGTLPQTIFFGALALIPFLLFLVGGSLFTIIAIIIFLMCGVSYALLVWLDFAQWIFDKYINPKIEGAKINRGVFNKDGTSASGDDSASSLEYQRMLLAHGRSSLVAKPIKPIDDSTQIYDLPTAFTREDLKRLRESKQNIIEDSEAYAEEHKNDLRYVEYNRKFDEREKAIQEEDEKKLSKKKGKKVKAIKPPKED